jgi:hypothetical protein
LEREAFIIEQAVEHAPGEGAVRSSPLERKVDEFEIGRAAGPNDPVRQLALASAAVAKSRELLVRMSMVGLPGRFRRDIRISADPDRSAWENISRPNMLKLPVHTECRAVRNR